MRRHRTTFPFVIVVISLFAGLVTWYSGIGSADTTVRTVVNVAPESTWRYSDRSTAPAANWKDAGFDDAGWKSGRAQLGFGDGGEATVLSGRGLAFYFRQAFSVDPDITSARLWLVVDDGAVVYLNGVEVARDNMPTGAITPTTRASTNRTGSAESAVRSFELPVSSLRAGANTIAVEVHQNWKSSSDLSFQAGLSTTVPVAVTSTASAGDDGRPDDHGRACDHGSAHHDRGPTTTTAAPTTTTAAPAPPAATQPATWSDEFNGASLDTSMWKPYNSTYGDGNHEMQCLTPANVTTSGGALNIMPDQATTTCPGGVVRNYSSGFVGTRETGHYFPMYGRFEMRAKLPHGQGIWPAFWLRHRNGAGTAEVDVMEYFHSSVPGQTTATLHLDGRRNLSKKRPLLRDPDRHARVAHLGGGHRAGPVRHPFTFSLDGVDYHSYVDTQHNWANGVDPKATWDIALNVAIGGDWLGDPAGTLGYLPDLNRCAQGGTPPSACRTDGILRAQFQTDLPGRLGPLHGALTRSLQIPHQHGEAPIGSPVGAPRVTAQRRTARTPGWRRRRCG